MHAIGSKKLEVVQKLLDNPGNKPDLNAQDDNGLTPLDYACVTKDSGLDVVKAIMKAKPKDWGEYRMGTALYRAVFMQII